MLLLGTPMISSDLKSRTWEDQLPLEASFLCLKVAEYNSTGRKSASGFLYYNLKNRPDPGRKNVVHYKALEKLLIKTEAKKQKVETALDSKEIISQMIILLPCIQLMSDTTTF